jgi:Flp pilus assembly protein TadG
MTIRNRFKDNRGSILLEFVVVCMLVLIIWGGMCNAALALKDKLTTVAAAREAARTYAVTESISDAKSKGYEILSAGGISKKRATVNIYRNDPAINLVRSEVSCSIPIAVPQVMALLGGDEWEDIKIRESAVFRLGL